MNHKRSPIVIVLLALSAAMYASWEYIGPEGGPIQSGAITAGPNKTVYIASNAQRVPLIKSTDNGATWARTGALLVSPPQGLLAHATDPQLLYYMDGRTAYGTTDGGNTWAQLAVPGTVNLCALEVNPDDWSELFGGGFQDANGNRLAVICHSTDAGQSWDIQTLGTVWGSTVTAIRVWSGGTDIIYASGTDPGGMLYQSTDHGASWNVVTGSGPAANVLDINPADVNLLLAGSGGGVDRSSDGGLSWSQVLTGECRSISRSAALPDLIYVPAGGLAFRSLDAGLTWTQVTDGLQGVVARCVLADPADDDVAYCGTSVDMYKSTERGGSWFPVHNGLLQYGDFNVLATSPDDPTVAYAGAHYCYPVHTTTDCGSSWTPSGTFRGCGELAGISCSRLDANRAWVFEGHG
jgi:photosystem II stability/assembly factor-like uncharacterized protein